MLKVLSSLAEASAYGVQSGWYFLDFCWISNFTFAAIGLVLFLEVTKRFDYFSRGNRTYNSISFSFYLAHQQVVQDSFPMVPLPELNFATRHPNFGEVAFIIATGPLAWSVIVLSNALVLHDIKHYSSTFIHLWPCWTTLSLRTHAEQLREVTIYTVLKGGNFFPL